MSLMVGPRHPVYLVSLAEALLKLKLCVTSVSGPNIGVCSANANVLVRVHRWKMAESAASRVLLLEPDHEKARLYRAQARKEQHRFKAAQAGKLIFLTLQTKTAP